MVEKIGPYRVYERLGVGGMGEVYKAYDDRLDRWVAIKRIRPDRLDAEDNRERFKREARATARLNHPSIVHLYGIFQDGDSDCIVMEYVDGKTLDQMLVEGPLDPMRVANLGHEIASGLAEAHANGILHRDLKAENIMITPRGRSKILDFGLAKPILSEELDPALTGKGQLVGTSRAMSPEYVSGEAVDHRSDLFSLGVLLYECATGHSPFKAHNTLATLKQVMLHKQAPIKQVNPKFPKELADLIESLLEKDPENRPQNAAEIALAFGRLTGQVSSGVVDIPGGLRNGDLSRHSSTLTPFSASDTVLDLRPRHRWMTLVAIVVVLLGVAFLLGRLFDTDTFEEPELPPEERIEIILADFQNNTDEETLGASLAEAFRAVIEQSRFNTVLSRGQIQAARERMGGDGLSALDRTVGLELLEREGAERLVVGSVSKFGRSYSLVVDVVDGTDSTTFSTSANAKNAEELLQAIEKSALEVRAHLGESADEIQKSEPLAQVATPDLEALKAYTVGVQKFLEDENEEAIRFYEQALALDDEFAMAHVKLGVLYSNLNNGERALHHFTEALKHSDRLSKVQEFYLNGWRARWEGAVNEIVKNWSLMSNLYPENSIAAFNLGMALKNYHNDFEGAIDAFERAISYGQPAEKYFAGVNMALCLIAKERLDEALAVLEEHGGQNVTFPRLMVYAARRNQAQIREEMTESLFEDTTDFHSFASLIALDRGALEEGLEHANRGIAFSEGKDAIFKHYRALADRATVYYLLGRHEQLVSEAKRVLEDSRGTLVPKRAEESPVTLLATLGQLLARSGRVDLAEEIHRLIETPASHHGSEVIAASAKWLQSEILLRSGRPGDALRVLDSTNPESVIGLSLRAEALYRLGEVEDALEVYGTVRSRRGLAFVECDALCAGRALAVSANKLADFESAKIFKNQGDLAASQDKLQALLQEWEGALPPPVKQLKEELGL